jgi:hypothetical protein
MYHFEAKTSVSEKVVKYQIKEDEQILTYSEVIQKWKSEADFRVFYTELLANSSFQAFFWEHPPLTLANQNQNYEFILYDAPTFLRVSADEVSFENYFSQATDYEGVVSFMNLGKNALLVVPCPLSDLENYTHLANFVRQAPLSQQHSLWQALAQALENQLNTNPIWLSTAGLGVYWLHIRLDKIPKYYHFKPYKLYEE